MSLLLRACSFLAPTSFRRGIAKPPSMPLTRTAAYYHRNHSNFTRRCNSTSASVSHLESEPQVLSLGEASNSDDIARPPWLDESWTKDKHRILWLKSAHAWGIYGHNDGNSPYYGSLQGEGDKEWQKRMKTLVEDDVRRLPSERIDSVAWYVDYEDWPTVDMWQALDGLSPKHLNMLAGYNEGYEVEGLAALRQPWDELETLRLTSLTGSSAIEKAPECFSRISSLSLYYCCAHNLVPRNAKRLKRLWITENNACDMFCYAVDHEGNPGLAEQLEVLGIETTNGCDMSHAFEPEDFRERLKKCTNLRELHYFADGSESLDVMLAGYIPNSVEKLTLGFTRSLPFLRNFDDWTSYATNSTWLPRLKSFKMTIDRGTSVMDLVDKDGWERVAVDANEVPPSVFDQEFEVKKNHLYDLLRSNKPDIDLHRTRLAQNQLNHCELYGKRTLWLYSIFAFGIYCSGDVHTFDYSPKEKRLEVQSQWFKALRDLVYTDAQRHDSDRIDSVAWLLETGEEPTMMMWQALDGLSPKHLHILSGFDETRVTRPLETLNYQWKSLETLYLSGICDSSCMDNAPTVLSQISYSCLDYCYAQNLVPPGSTKLKHFRIIENNACDMFMYAIDDNRNPGLAHQLEVLEIVATNGRDISGQYEPQDFRDRLRECKNLRELRLTIGIHDGLDVNLAADLPDSVQTLELTFTHSYPVLRHFNDWIEHASDPAWLPHLGSFSMAILDENDVRDLEVDSEGFRLLVDPPPGYDEVKFEKEFMERRLELYGTLKSNRPVIELLGLA
ncbi:hypothetical protein CVT26_007120 [Gymnopilus dilepis]|uniref:Uncharacterized protein n=1 Tax=Gymnopilus dilepis TaxID=231916 RepID=A0A409WQ83_9AGAR|nr:hypothetical protein CVT26_007120 [Gymnopilus dilepis]